MAKRKKPRPAPLCAHCSQPAHLVTGREVYPHRPDLHDRVLWKCTACTAWVGCHRGGDGSRPLGTPANLELRNARGILHERAFDPLWKTAIQTGDYEPEGTGAAHAILGAARTRCYLYLAHHMGLDIKACHIGMFTLAQCREAWVILKPLTYPIIRAWCQAQRVATAAVEHRFDAAQLKYAALNECEGCRANWPLKDGRHAGGIACTALPVREAMRWLEEHPDEARQHAAALTPTAATEAEHGNHA